MYRLSNLIRERSKRRWTQQYLADQLGVTKQTIGRWERCEFPAPRAMQQQIADIFGLPASFLFTQKNEEEEFHNEEPVLPMNPMLGEKIPDATHSRVLGQELLSPKIVDPGIPQLPSMIIGRQHELASLKQRLLSNKNVLLTALNGIPGVGKTTLSIALAHDQEIRAYFYDGILWAGLGPEPNISSILSHWGALLSISATEDENAWERTLKHAIGYRRMLIIIDDVWRSEDAQAFKVGGPNCSYLITTRYPSEANFLDPVHPLQLDELNGEDSLALLSSLAPQAVINDPQQAKALVEAVGGLPLALTITGNFLRRQSYSGQSRRIKAAFLQLQEPELRLQLQEPKGAVEAHPSLSSNMLSLEQIIAASDTYLTPVASQALYALAILPAKPNTFSEEVALTIINEEALDTLIDAGLITMIGDRLTVHQAIHDYARDRLEKNPALKEEVSERLMTFVLEYASRDDGAQLLVHETPLVMAALERAKQQSQAARVIIILRFSADYFIHVGSYAFLDPYLRYGLQECERIEDRFFLALKLAHTLQPRGYFQEAHDLLQTHLNLAREIENDEFIGLYLGHLGWLLPKMGLYSEAEDYLKQALERTQDQQQICKIYMNLGIVYDLLAKYEASFACKEQALAMAQELHDIESQCILHENMGVNFATRGFEEKAEAHWEQALRLAEENNVTVPRCSLLINIAELHNQRETVVSLQKALVYLQKCKKLAESIGSLEWYAVSMVITGSVQRKQGCFDAATASLHEALRIAQQIIKREKHRIFVQVYIELGDIAVQTAKFEEAEAFFRQALQMTPEGDVEMQAMLLYSKAKNALAQKNFSLARRYGSDSLAIFERIGHGWGKKLSTWIQSIPAH